MTAVMPLTRLDKSVRTWTIVDYEDYERFGGRRYHLMASRGHGPGYAVRTARDGDREIAVPLHREILGLEPNDPRETDHINGDKLDNRRLNLRIVTRAQQMQNHPGCRGAKSPFRGVSYDASKPGRPWRARGHANGRNVHIGRFATEEEAADAAVQWRRQNMPYATD